MAEDGDQVVQSQEPVSQEQVQPKPAETKPAEQPLTAEAIQKMIEEATTKAVAAAKDIGRRELQSEQDRNRAEALRAQRRAQLAESTLGAARIHLQGVDPEAAKELELAELRAKEQGRTVQEQEEAAAEQQKQFHQQFNSNLNQFITGLGVDPTDKRIDWAGDAPNYLVAQQRILESVSKIQKENIQTMQTGLEKRLKDLEAKVGKVAEEANIEANSVSTTTSLGVVAGSDAEFVKKFGNGELPMSKANVDRYNKIIKNY